MSATGQSRWQLIAIASGAFASFNALFAKLTTDDTTASWASHFSQATGQELHQQYIEYATRLLIFILSFVFSGIMWALYTRALSLAPSSIQASIVNTSTNFILTALLGVAVFGEKLPMMWWVGAGLLISGTVVIGKREEAKVHVPEKKAQ